MRLITASQLKLLYGAVEIFADIDLEVTEGDRIGIIGPNGGGKTSLLRIVVGALEPNGGTLARAPGLRIGYVSQTPAQAAGGSLRDEVMTAFDKLRQLEDALALAGQQLQWATEAERRQVERTYSALLQEYESLGGYDYQHRMERIVAGVGLSPETLDTPVASASGGERTRAALATALLTDPDLLVLDEPTNYLDFKGLDWLEGFLGHFSHAFVVVSHDRYFLDQVVNQIWELDHGRLQRFPGNYTKYRMLKAEQTKRQHREFERQQEYIAKEEAFIERYHAGQRAREAKGRQKKLGHLERLDAPQRDETIHIGGVDAGRAGHIVLWTHDLQVGFVEDGRTLPLVSVPDVALERGSRTAIIGSNGIGKTTLLRTVLGAMPPLSGSVSLGLNVEVGYFHQGHTDLPNDSTVLDALLDVRNMPIGDARSYLARFLFRGEDVYKLVAALSGGERSRLSLARLLAAAPNFLVLDEPTTHLDIPSREALEQALLSYDGTLIFVSHDRRLISLLAQQLWVLEDGALHPFEGTFEEWAQAVQAAQRPAAQPQKHPAKRRAPAPAKAAPREPAPDHEQIISELEERLAGIERALQAASERQDVAEVARLGTEYNQARAALDEAWEAWSG